MPKKRSLVDDLIILPWWFNLALAAVVYAFLKFWLPTIEFHSPVFRGFATAIPNMAGIFASVLVFAAVMSAFHSWRKGDLLNKQTSIRSVRKLPWKDFEFLVGEAYRRQGYNVQEDIGAGPDGGVDLTLTKGGGKYLVQCKNWKTKSVGVPVVRELFGVVTAENASGGIIVCSGGFTRDAVEFARGKSIELVGGAELIRLIGDVQKSPKIKPVVKETACPVCRSPMVMRTARRGKSAGKSFWGCSKYPKCRGTMSV